MLRKNKLIAALLSAAVTFSLIPGGVYAAGGVDDDELFLNLVEQVVIKVNDDTMIKLGKRADLTETNAGVPHYVDGNLVVPLRFLEESFYGDIDYDPFAERTTITFDRGIFELGIGEKEFEFEGEKKTFSVAPFLINNRTYVALNDIVELLGMSVTYGEKGIVVVSPLANINKEYFTTPVYNEIDRILETEITETMVLYVAVDGKADATGTKDDPFDRIEHARDKIRELKKDGVERNYKVIIGEGKYDVKESVVFEQEDSATISTTIEYVAEEGAKVEFSSGYTLDTWEKYDDNIYMVELPEKRTDLWWVFEDGVVGTKSRYPNEGYTLSNNPAGVYDYHTYRDDVPDIEWKSDLQIGSYMGGSGGEWMWTWFYRYVKSIDKENKIFKMSDVIWGRHPSYSFGKGTKYALFNSLELIDVPGECYYDRETNILYYYPRNPDRINNVIIPRPIDIFQFKSEDKTKLIRNITVNGVETTGTDWVSERAFVDNQLLHSNYPEAAGSAVLVQNAAGIIVKNCKFNNVGLYALNLKNNCYNNRLESCAINNIGDSAVGRTGAIEANNSYVANAYKYNNYDKGYSYNSFTSIENCEISEVAFFTTTSSAIHPLGSFMHIANNHISDIRRCGISFENKNMTNRKGITIEYNTLTNNMYDSQDGAPIYTQGECGTVRHNFVYKNGTNTGIMTYMYLDDDTHYMNFYKNLYIDLSMDVDLDASHGQVAVSLKSLSNKIYNNIMDDLNTYAGLTMNKQPWDRPQDATFKNNVITDAYSRTTGKFSMYDSIIWDDKLLREFDGNVIYNEVGEYTVDFPTLSSMDDLRNAFEGKFSQKDVIGVKPIYMDEENDDYRMRYDSIAYATGFEDLKISNAGLREDYPFADDSLPLETLYVKRKGDFADKATILLKNGGTAELEVIGRTGGSRYKRNPEAKYLSYSSDNTAVATVSNGVIKAQGEGKALITVTYNDGKANISTQIYVFVDDFAIDKYVVFGHEDGSSVQKEVDISGTSGTTPFIYAISKYGRIMSLNGRKTSFELEDKIANVDEDGRLTGVTPGNTTLKVDSKVTDNEVDELKIDVRVISDFYSGMVADTPSNGIKLGEKAEIIGSGTSRRTGEVHEVPISLESTDESVLKVVEEDGKNYVEAVGLGTANIIAKYTEVSANILTSTVTMYVLSEEDMALYGFKLRDIGACKIPGSIREVENGHFKMYSSGFDVYSANDEFTFLRKEQTGNAEIIVTVESIEKLHSSTAVGPMFRVDDTAHAYNVHYRMTPDGGTLVTWKNEEAPNSSYKAGAKITFPATLKLERIGDTFKCYYLDDNGLWIENISVKLKLPKTLLAGIGGFSRMDGKEAGFGLTNLQVNSLANANLEEVNEKDADAEVTE